VIDGAGETMENGEREGRGKGKSKAGADLGREEERR